MGRPARIWKLWHSICRDATHRIGASLKASDRARAMRKASAKEARKAQKKAHARALRRAHRESMLSKQYHGKGVSDSDSSLSESEASSCESRLRGAESEPHSEPREDLSDYEKDSRRSKGKGKKTSSRRGNIAPTHTETSSQLDEVPDGLEHESGSKATGEGSPLNTASSDDAIPDTDTERPRLSTLFRPVERPSPSCGARLEIRRARSAST